MTRCRIPIWRAICLAFSNSPEARLGLTAVTAKAKSPHASYAARATTALSTPPEKRNSHSPRLPQAVDQRSSFLGQEGCGMHGILDRNLPGREFPRQESQVAGGSGFVQEFTNRDLWGLSLIAGLLIP